MVKGAVVATGAVTGARVVSGAECGEVVTGGLKSVVVGSVEVLAGKVVAAGVVVAGVVVAGVVAGAGVVVDDAITAVCEFNEITMTIDAIADRTANATAATTALSENLETLSRC